MLNTKFHVQQTKNERIERLAVGRGFGLDSDSIHDGALVVRESQQDKRWRTYSSMDHGHARNFDDMQLAKFWHRASCSVLAQGGVDQSLHCQVILPYP